MGQEVQWAGQLGEGPGAGIGFTCLGGGGQACRRAEDLDQKRVRTADFSCILI